MDTCGYNGYTVIIPTMWKTPSVLLRMLQKYDECDLIDEVVIINNNPKHTIPLCFNKVKLYCDGGNIYVNPAWNLGVRMAKSKKLIIANDDIYIQYLDTVMRIIDYNLAVGVVIGIHNTCYRKQILNPDGLKIGLIRVEPAISRNWGWGTFIAIYKTSYINIPNEYKIWCGDDFQFSNNKAYAIHGFEVETVMSSTLRKDKMLMKIALRDKNTYNKKVNNKQKR